MTIPEPILPRPILPRPAPLLGPTTTASVLVGASCLVSALEAWSAWHRLAVGTDYAAGVPGVWVADLTSADATARTIAALYLIAATSAGLAMLVWLSRVRANMRLLGGTPRPRRTAWVLGAWVASTVVTVVLTLLLRDAATVGELRALAVAETACSALQCVAGGLAILVVRRVTRWQSAPCRPAPA